MYYLFTSDFNNTGKDINTFSNTNVIIDSINGIPCAYFDGSAFIDIGFPNYTNATFGYWIYYPGTSTSSMTPISIGNATTSSIYSDLYNLTGVWLFARSGGSTTNNVNILANTTYQSWVHITYTYSQISPYTCSIYINGSKIATANGTGTFTNTPTRLLLGKGITSLQAYTGYIRNFFVINKILTDSKIMELYTNTTFSSTMPIVTYTATGTYTTSIYGNYTILKYTSGSGTFIPTNTNLKVGYLVVGGGSGGNPSGYANNAPPDSGKGGAGGNGGAIAYSLLNSSNLTINKNITCNIVVGSGSASNNPGNNSSLNTTIVAQGGTNRYVGVNSMYGRDNIATASGGINNIAGKTGTLGGQNNYPASGYTADSTLITINDINILNSKYGGGGGGGGMGYQADTGGNSGNGGNDGKGGASYGNGGGPGQVGYSGFENYGGGGGGGGSYYNDSTYINSLGGNGGNGGSGVVIIYFKTYQNVV